MMPHDLFSADDIRRIRAHGLTEARVVEQIQLLNKGAIPIRLNRPCTVGDGILSIPEADLEGLVKQHDQGADRGRIMKLVPASGAASRMFKDWFRYLTNGCFNTPSVSDAFAGDIKNYAFYEDLERWVGQRGESLAAWIEQGRNRDILAAILTTGGLNYASLPKALLKFHTYPEGSRTALEEHLVEAALYTQDHQGTCRVHFTVSAEHLQAVKACLAVIKKRYEKREKVHLDITLSVQSSSTDTIAADGSGRPFRDDAGQLVLRPGGHGALLANLNQLENGDIVFLKNIDNIVPDRLKPSTVLYKKIISGYLMNLQGHIHQYLEIMAERTLEPDILEELIFFCERDLLLVLPKWFCDLSDMEKQAVLLMKLNRPLRVCGMVKNEGEPGGGPFWVDEADGTQSLQIVEESQIDRRSDAQCRLWSAATHFNPVDLVCGIRDYRNRKFDLSRFVDQKAYVITEKSEKGRALRALEHPGFWNGAMHDWMTIFVEVPIETFNPVKTIQDLLRPQHRPE